VDKSVWSEFANCWCLLQRTNSMCKSDITL